MSQIQCSNAECETRSTDVESPAFTISITVGPDCEFDDNLKKTDPANFSCWVCGEEAESVSPKVVEEPDFCPSSEDGKHRPYGVSGPVAGYKDLVVDITCLHCGVSGSVTIDTEDVLW